MKYKILSVVIIGVLLAATSIDAFAQKMITVSGKVLNSGRDKNGNRNLPFTDDLVDIYSYNTVADAEDNFKMINDPTKSFISENHVIAEANGYYEITVPDNGALIFRAGLNSPKLERLKGRMVVNVFIEGDILMDEVSVVGKLINIQPIPKAPDMYGNRFMPYNTFPIPKSLGKSNARLVLQPYVLDCNTGDTVSFCDPVVFDGKEFTKTQIRWKGFEMRRDPLYPYVREMPLTSHRSSFDWADTIIVPNPNHSYSCFADIVLENYHKVYYRRTYQINTCKNRRPFQFLEFVSMPRYLDINAYRKRAQRERRSTSDKLQLTFLQGKDIFNDKNLSNERNLQLLRQKLTDIVNSEGTVLKEFKLKGVASPEGSYERNKDLAMMRLKRIEREVKRILTPSVSKRVYINYETEVASWNTLSDSLQSQYPDLAKQVREIADNKISNSAKWERIKKLPMQNIVQDYIGRLRQVKYDCHYEIFRELTPDEVWQLYQDNKNEKMPLYMYWYLFQREKDPAQLEALYKRAYEESKEVDGKPWILAGNLLAASYLRRDTADTNILDPFINTAVHKVNVERMALNGHLEIINPEEVVVNQLLSCIKSNNYVKASVLVQLLPSSPENDTIIAFTQVMGGYYKGGSTLDEQQSNARNAELVSSTSFLNKAIMLLAMNNPHDNGLARRALQELSKDKALTWYLMAIMESRSGDAGLMNCQLDLEQCYQRDTKFVKISQVDGDLNSDAVSLAVENYENQMK